jgi:PhnB protein
MKLIPYLHFAGNAEEVLNFYAKVFGEKILMMSRYGESPMPCDDDYKNKVMHARLSFGDSLIMVSDAMKGRPVSTDGNIDMSVEVDDVEKMGEVFNSLAEGGTITMPLQKQFWGATFGMLKDKFGIKWMFNSEEKQ